MKKNFSRLSKLFRNKWFIIIAVVVIIILIYAFTRGGPSQKIESAVASIGNIIEKVDVTGKVMPLDKVNLSFEKGGAVAKVNVKIGDRVKKGDLIASLNSADDAANLASAEAQLAEIRRGLRPEEYSADKAVLDSASTTLKNSTKDALNAVRDGYVKAQSAVVNYTDTFFDNPQSVNPGINIRVQSTSWESSIKSKRIAVTETLTRWKNDIDSLNTQSDMVTIISKVESYLDTIRIFMGDLSLIVNDLSTGNSGLTQAVITSHISTMNTALSTFNQAVSSVTTADTALKSASSAYDQAFNKFTLQKAGSSQESIASQAARVEQARAQLMKDMIYSPIDGTVTRADPKVGEFASVGQTSFSVQNDGAYKIEAYVPEADIAKIKKDNVADVTLDAYSSDEIFKATVTTIDPAETILDNVPTYKVTLVFSDKDDRIRSGMTANTEIFTNRADNVIVIPTRAIISENSLSDGSQGKKTVRILNSDEKTFVSVPVVTGLRGSDGTIEIKSGISKGQKVVTYVK